MTNVAHTPSLHWVMMYGLMVLVIEEDIAVKQCSYKATGNGNDKNATEPASTPEDRKDIDHLIANGLAEHC
jgi:hypothetical protein